MAGLLGLVLGLLVWALLFATRSFGMFREKSRVREPPRLKETIPYVSNVVQFMTNKKGFISRVRAALSTEPIVQGRIGPLNVYFIPGGEQISAIFRSSFHSEPFILQILQSAGYTASDMANYFADKTGPASLPRPGGSNSLPLESRIWHASHRMHNETLISPHHVAAFSKAFQRSFDAELSTFTTDAWVENVDLFHFIKLRMAAASTRAFFGPKIIDVNPGFMDLFWQYEKHLEGLAFGLSAWLNRPAVRMRDRFNAMCGKWYELSNAQYDWSIADEALDWEPLFGLQFGKGLTRWAKSFHISIEGISSTIALTLYGLHANVVPICTWVMFELLKDSQLFQAVKDEIKQAELSGASSNTYFDHKKLTSQPLLQSIVTEVLRLHACVLITRKSTEPLVVAGYMLPTGSLIQAPAEISHLDDTVWGTPEHPASEFWAHRHVKEIESVDSRGCRVKSLEYSLAGRTNHFFPFGGGISICAGRHFANVEILLAVAMLVSKMEIDVIGWIKLDGSPSQRGAKDDIDYPNPVTTPPDRDLRLRWRRRF